MSSQDSYNIMYYDSDMTDKELYKQEIKCQEFNTYHKRLITFSDIFWIWFASNGHKEYKENETKLKDDWFRKWKPIDHKIKDKLIIVVGNELVIVTGKWRH